MIKKALKQTLKILLILLVAAAVVCGLWYFKKDTVAGVKYYHFDTAAFDDKCAELSDASKANDADEMIRLYDELYSDCGYLIAFISNNYIASNNCKDEINFARDLDKDRLLVSIEDTTLPLGMSMRLRRLQAIHEYKYDDKEDFYGKLLSAAGIEKCR